jgi:hypothetical protein
MLSAHGRPPCRCPPPTPSPAACGFLGTLIGKRLIQTLGLLRAGAAALLIQACLLGGATAIFTALLAGPPELGPGGGALHALGGGGGWPELGGVALPVVAFAGAAAASRGACSCTLAASS